MNPNKIPEDPYRTLSVLIVLYLLRLCTKAVHDLEALFCPLVGYEAHADFTAQSPRQLAILLRWPFPRDQ